jgi:hypothetical protein
MAEPFKEVFGADHVIASDIYDFGYGETYDFLSRRSINADWIVTNPPFKKAMAFVEHGLRLAERGVIVLCRMSFLESAERHPLIWIGDNPMTAMMPFCERVSMQLGSWDPKGHFATAYSCFAFHKGRAPVAPIPFPPGTSKRFTKYDDAARFAYPAPVPMFEKVASAELFAT